MRRRGLPGRCQEGNIIKEGCRSKGHIIKDGVVGPGQQANCLGGHLVPFDFGLLQGRVDPGRRLMTPYEAENCLSSRFFLLHYELGFKAFQISKD